MKRVLIGSAAHCDFKVSDRTVSREHAELVVKDDGTCFIIDRNSTNGTFIRDSSGQSESGWKRVSQAAIENNEVVLIGRYQLNIREVLATLVPPAKPEEFIKPKPEKFVRDENGHIIPVH